MTIERSPRLLALLGTAPLLACAPPPLTGEGADDTETGGEAQECEVPPDDAEAGVAQPILLSNSGDLPIWIVPASDCTDTIFHSMTLDGGPAEDDVMETCSSLANHGCDSCDESYFGHSPIRIDPGAGYEWSFDGYLFATREFDSACGFEAACWSGLVCEVGVAVPDNTVLEAQLRFTDECLLGTACDCPPGESACELPSISNNYMSFGELKSASVEFEHLGGSLPVVFLDAG